MTGALAARAHCWRGHLFAFFKRYRRAIDEFRAALSLDPGIAGEHELAVAEQKRGDSFDPKMGAQTARDIGSR